ncbi:MAG: hypothetical protein KDA93_17815 [Planctomycetaceae bacterium]|nr:hypothetical protein [Planctomycetaceae bacterium]
MGDDTELSRYLDEPPQAALPQLWFGICFDPLDWFFPANWIIEVEACAGGVPVLDRVTDAIGQQSLYNAGVINNLRPNMGGSLSILCKQCQSKFVNPADSVEDLRQVLSQLPVIDEREVVVSVILWRLEI